MHALSSMRLPPTQNSGNPLHTSFKNPLFPPNQITPENVLSYFSHPNNPFYDNSCCNAQVRMQNIHRPLEECLLSLTGIQYVLWRASPPLYVICKLRRNTATDVTPLAYYHVINGVIYQAPDMYAIVQSRLVAAIQPLRSAFQTALQYKRYNVARGYYWDFGKPVEETETKKEEKPVEQRSSAFQQQRVDNLLRVIYKQFPPINTDVVGGPAGDVAAASEAPPADEGGEGGGGGRAESPNDSQRRKK